MSRGQILKSWLDGAENSITTAKDMLKLNHRDWSLFFCHLAIEKILKARLYKNGVDTPVTHNLVKLAKASKIGMDNKILSDLAEITTYNVSARYDDEKRSFYKKATAPYAKKWFQICSEIYQKIKGAL
ncbi:hypothetical protein COT50_03250 [candidate division WWE3 bacterium CG08_land_8_20_14_0_20_41_10]|uniref:HEPN domain-containing protein n=1 Tax=candidate division WWE3 bacterium CG08_land_8_20_14_0_20_41_10 TaxID=1975085 RepID=A0A2H0XB99_UNCKA|nr:MAG: hypothetical protein COT50_03250 [candidate division WWE3 bacterium CG08_land_8_20_14_0_20_41_10]